MLFALVSSLAYSPNTQEDSKRYHYTYRSPKRLRGYIHSCFGHLERLRDFQDHSNRRSNYKPQMRPGETRTQKAIAKTRIALTEISFPLPKTLEIF